uniref:RNA polymerase sigma-70 domain-containing protein n=1 Tax=Salix viminalis TaxID=40686 RepID=A0A6N2LX11_SALVM
MMTTTSFIGLGTGKRLLSSSFYYSDLTEKLSNVNDHGLAHHQITTAKSVIVAKKSSKYGPSFLSSYRNPHSTKVLKEHIDTASASSTVATWFKTLDEFVEESCVLDYSVEVLILLQKSILEKQWNLSFEQTNSSDSTIKKSNKKIPVTGSGMSARQRRLNNKRKNQNQSKLLSRNSDFKLLRSDISQDLLLNRLKGYVKGVVSDEVLPHTEVVRLSRIIRAGLSLEDHKSSLKERLGCEPSDKQLADSLRISRSDLQSKLIQCSLAREKLAMSNVRLVMSIAQKNDNMGAEMADLVQAGLIGLLRGIEKFDSSKGFKISTYVYWWIRQGVSRALVENSRTLRLPNHLHERLGLIRNAKIRLEEKGVTPSIDRIAESLNMSQRKIRNATEAISKVFSLDREAFPSLNGLPGETHHSYIADNHLENNPWHGVDEGALKEEVNKLIDSALQEREREIIRLYHGLDKECLTWEGISKRMGLSRERVRQVGLVALEKLKHAARKTKLEAMLVKH